MGEYAEVRDVEVEWNQAIPSDATEHVDRQISRAEAILAVEVPDLARRVTDGALSTETIRDVVAGMVVRLLRNPDGRRSSTRGPFSFTLDTAVAAGRLFLSREDRRVLGLRSGARSIPMGDDTLADVVTGPPRFRL